MSKIALSLNGEQEITDVMSALVTIVQDVKSGKGITQEVEDLLAGAIKVAGEVPAIKGDVSADPAGCVASVLAGGFAIYGALK